MSREEKGKEKIEEDIEQEEEEEEEEEEEGKSLGEKKQKRNVVEEELKYVFEPQTEKKTTLTFQDFFNRVTAPPPPSSSTSDLREILGEQAGDSGDEDTELDEPKHEKKGKKKKGKNIKQKGQSKYNEKQYINLFTELTRDIEIDIPVNVNYREFIKTIDNRAIAVFNFYTSKIKTIDRPKLKEFHDKEGHLDIVKSSQFMATEILCSYVAPCLINQENQADYNEKYLQAKTVHSPLKSIGDIDDYVDEKTGKQIQVDTHIKDFRKKAYKTKYVAISRRECKTNIGKYFSSILMKALVDKKIDMIAHQMKARGIETPEVYRKGVKASIRLQIQKFCYFFANGSKPCIDTANTDMIPRNVMSKQLLSKREMQSLYENYAERSNPLELLQHHYLMKKFSEIDDFEQKIPLSIYNPDGYPIIYNAIWLSEFVRKFDVFNNQYVKPHSTSSSDIIEHTDQLLRREILHKDFELKNEKKGSDQASRNIALYFVNYIYLIEFIRLTLYLETKFFESIRTKEEKGIFRLILNQMLKIIEGRVFSFNLYCLMARIQLSDFDKSSDILPYELIIRTQSI